MDHAVDLIGNGLCEFIIVPSVIAVDRDIHTAKVGRPGGTASGQSCLREVPSRAIEMRQGQFWQAEGTDAASGQAFQDTYFYSLSNAKAERRANTFAAELLLSDDDVLKPIGFYEFNADRLQMEASLPTHCSSTYRALKYHELLQDFQYTHTGFATLEEIAQMAGIEKNFVDFKLNILTAKGYQLPAVPELKSNFLKDSMKNCSKSYD